MARVSITVNGRRRTADVEPRLLLVHFLREHLDLTGAHVGCDTSQCGACTVLVDGRSAKSCTIFAVQADGSEVTTIEGLADGDRLHPLQEGFWEEHGLQCGYCTPGMILSAVNLLDDNPTPTEQEIRDGPLDGNPMPLHGVSAHRQRDSARGRADGAIGRRRVAASMTPAFPPASAELLCRARCFAAHRTRPLPGRRAAGAASRAEQLRARGRPARRSALPGEPPELRRRRATASAMK